MMANIESTTSTSSAEASSRVVSDAVDKSLKKAGAAGERKDSFLVVEEHIETKHLPVASDQDEDSCPEIDEDNSLIVTCGTLIIKPQGSDSDKLKIPPLNKKEEEISEAKRGKMENLKNKRKKEQLGRFQKKRENKENMNLFNKMGEHQLTPFPHNNEFDFGTSKMASSKETIKEEKSSTEEKMQSESNQSDPVSQVVHTKINAERDADQKIGADENLQNLFPDFSVSVLKFQDAIDSFTQAVFNDGLKVDLDAMEEPIKEDEQSNTIEIAEQVEKQEEINRTFCAELEGSNTEDLGGNLGLSEIVEEPIFAEKAYLVQGNMKETVCQELSGKNTNLDDNLKNIEIVEEPIVAEKAYIVGNESTFKTEVNTLEPIETTDISESRKLSDLCNEDFLKKDLVESKLMQAKESICLDGNDKVNVEAAVESVRECLFPGEEKGQATTKTKKFYAIQPEENNFASNNIQISNNINKELLRGDEGREEINQVKGASSQGPVPDIFIQADGDENSRKVSKSEDWIKIPIKILSESNNITDDHSSGKSITIQEIASSEKIEEINSIPPIVSEAGMERSSKKSSLPSQTFVEFEDVTDNSTNSETRIDEVEPDSSNQVNDIHLAFSRKIDERLEEVGTIGNAIKEIEASSSEAKDELFSASQIDVDPLEYQRSVTETVTVTAEEESAVHLPFLRTLGDSKENVDEFNEILKDIDTKVNVVQNNLSTPNLSVSEGLKYDVYAKEIWQPDTNVDTAIPEFKENIFKPEDSNINEVTLSSKENINNVMSYNTTEISKAEGDCANSQGPAENKMQENTDNDEFYEQALQSFKTHNDAFFEDLLVNVEDNEIKKDVENCVLLEPLQNESRMQEVENSLNKGNQATIQNQVESEIKGNNQVQVDPKNSTDLTIKDEIGHTAMDEPAKKTNVSNITSNEGENQEKLSGMAGESMITIKDILCIKENESDESKEIDEFNENCTVLEYNLTENSSKSVKDEGKSNDEESFRSACQKSDLEPLSWDSDEIVTYLERDDNVKPSCQSKLNEVKMEDTSEFQSSVNTQNSEGTTKKDDNSFDVSKCVDIVRKVEYAEQMDFHIKRLTKTLSESKMTSLLKTSEDLDMQNNNDLESEEVIESSSELVEETEIVDVNIADKKPDRDAEQTRLDDTSNRLGGTETAFNNKNSRLETLNFSVDSRTDLHARPEKDNPESKFEEKSNECERKLQENSQMNKNGSQSNNAHQISQSADGHQDMSDHQLNSWGMENLSWIKIFGLILTGAAVMVVYLSSTAYDQGCDGHEGDDGEDGARKSCAMDGYIALSKLNQIL